MLTKVAIISLLPLLLGIAVAQDTCPLTTYCGHVCCPSPTRCCAVTSNPMDFLSTCCTADSTNVERTCGSLTCPSELSQNEVYDTQPNPNELRNECCLYFRDGCCSASENAFLDLLFKLALGLGIGLAGLLVIIIILVVCCCCCVCCD